MPEEMACISAVSERTFEMPSFAVQIAPQIHRLLRRELESKGCENIRILDPERRWHEPFEDEDPDSLTFGEKFEGRWMWEIHAIAEKRRG